MSDWTTIPPTCQAGRVQSQGWRILRMSVSQTCPCSNMESKTAWAEAKIGSICSPGGGILASGAPSGFARGSKHHLRGGLQVECVCPACNPIKRLSSLGMQTLSTRPWIEREKCPERRAMAKSAVSVTLCRASATNHRPRQRLSLGEQARCGGSSGSFRQANTAICLETTKSLRRHLAGHSVTVSICKYKR